MIMNRIWAMPSKNTFEILPIKNLLKKYIGDKENKIIIEPFANKSTWGTIRNDLNPEFDTDFHLDALEFLKMFDKNYANIVLYDPPFSINQAAECYKSYGKEKLKVNVASMKYWKECKDNVARILKPNGIAICCGWSSMGIGIARNFEMIEVLLCPHGGSKNDTIVTVERKKTTEQMTFYNEVIDNAL